MVGGEGFGVFLAGPAAGVRRYAAHVAEQRIPILPAGNMPPVGADALCARRRVAVHGRAPAVEIPVFGHVGDVAVRVAAGGFRGGSGGAQRNQGAVGETGAPHVLLHPALRTDGHGMVEVLVIIPDGGNPADERAVVRDKADRLAIRRGHAVGGVGPDVVYRVGFEIGEAAGEVARAGTARDVCVAQSGGRLGAPTDAAVGDGQTAVVHHRAAGDRR